MKKEIILRINHSKVNFTYVEEEIAKYFLNNNPCLPISELSINLCVSPASITRFCKKIGLNNYKELVYLYTEHLKEENSPSISKIAKDIQESYFKIFSNIDLNFDYDVINKICEYIHNNRLIHIFAFGLSATAAQDFKFRFDRMGKVIEVIHDKDAIKMASAVLEKGDLVFLFTLRGNRALEMCAENLKAKGVILITITGNPESILTKISDEVLLTSNLSGEESTGMISAQIPILIQIDLLHYYYVRKYSEVLEQWASTEKVFNGYRED
ncbi:MurR/RpiR family transcriptional regulator [Clostridium sp.]|uniref:MurR/RpiR family transcriptional regulator n=1 Tax=Clostridium sp. TaxID=1506 RepID=UPI0026244838|nr:MurR/RpiR family transcriptional regulator [Clostridium sp.]